VNLNVPGATLSAGLNAVIGVNTTSAPVSVSDIPTVFSPTLAWRSAVLLVEGQLRAGGFHVRGKFGITVSGEWVQMLTDAGLDVFSLADVRVTAAAAVYYGANPGLVLDAGLGAGFKLAAPGFTFFEIVADLRLSTDGRAGQRRFEVAVPNARVNLLSVFESAGGATAWVNGGSGNDTVRVASSGATLKLDVDADSGDDRVELYGTVAAHGGSGGDTLRRSTVSGPAGGLAWDGFEHLT
jgi:hypothetical protein